MAAVSQVKVLTEPERRMQQRSQRSVLQVEKLAVDADLARGRIAEPTRQLETLRGLHPEYVNPNMRQLVGWWGLIGALAGVLILSIVLEWPTSTYYGKKFVGLKDSAWLAGIVIPTSLFIFELFVVAAGRITAREEVIEALPASWYGWTAVALAITLTVPLLTLAAQMATVESNYTDQQIPLSEILKIAGITLMAIVCHGSVSFSGTGIQDAKGFAVYRVLAGRHERKIESLNTLVRHARTRATLIHQAAVQLAGPGGPQPTYSQRAADFINGTEPAPGRTTDGTENTRQRDQARNAPQDASPHSDTAGTDARAAEARRRQAETEVTP